MPALGLVLALAAGACLGGITSFSSLAFEQGATVAELMVARSFLAVLVVAAFCRLLGQPLVPERTTGYFLGIAIGVCLAVLGFGYMGSVHFITPGIAVALLLVYPILVFAIESAVQRKAPDAPTVLAFSLVLAGIALTLGAGTGSIDWRGIALALTAALGMAGMLVLTAESSRRELGMAVLMPAHSAAMVAVAFYLAVTEGGSRVAPLPPEGVLFIAAVALLFGFGILLSYIAVRIAPAGRVAMGMNIEPLVTLLLAWHLVGEELAPLQYAGILMAVAGVAFGGMLGRFATRTGATRLGL